jgi:hypothetical protein
LNRRTGLALNLVDNALLIAFAIRHRDRFLFRLLLFGLVTGLAELPAEHLAGGSHPDIGLLDRWRPDTVAIAIWMPLAWEIVAVQFGYIGLRLMERFDTIIGLVGVGILGAINIPFYEQMARTIHWWTYHGSRMVSATPYYHGFLLSK